MQAESTGRVKGWQRAAERLLGRSSQYASKSQQRLEEEGVSHTARKHPLTGRWEIAPVLDGRIQRVGGSVHGGSQAGSVHGSADGAAA